MTPSEILQLNLNDSSLDLLNAAIASHNVKLEQDDQLLTSTEDEANVTHDDQTATAPKRAGRKPLDKSQTAESSLDPKQKRKAQNRAAQRAFRDRKEKHVAELQARIDELERINATKDEDLVKENETLKEMLKQLQQENYALKGAQFTFEFPVHSSDTNTNTNTTTTTTTTTTPSKHETYTTSGSSMSSSNSYSGEETNSQLSPLSNSHTHEDDSTSADTPIANLFSAEPMQFGLIQPSETNMNFLSVSNPNNNYHFGNQPDTATQNLGTPSINNVDLFHGKDDLFTNYRTPSNTNDDFLFANEDLSSLFGGNNELFGFNNNQFAFDQASFGLEPFKCTEQKKQAMLDTLKKGQEEGKYIYQIHQEIKQQCPSFDIDALCDELKLKAKCSLSQHPLTDYDVQAFVKCLDRV
ncbi:hypothetical protein INT48_003495 [Thamnidium elegans]|uniref:BZIP domain-containing protein n=1 Tax=Thamnidium elegans TaxID=101142 RepID=A0A8H7SK44_9FUNG|nr:hypothetical protein INT48_003495 [Thamnidium elegans]